MVDLGGVHAPMAPGHYSATVTLLPGVHGNGLYPPSSASFDIDVWGANITPAGVGVGGNTVGSDNDLVLAGRNPKSSPSIFPARKARRWT